MKTSPLLLIPLSLLLLSAGRGANETKPSQASKAQPSKQNTKSDKDADAIDPSALTALTRMGTYLRSLKSFQVQAQTTTDEVLDDGQSIQFAGTLNIVAKMPDRLMADVQNDKFERRYLYDGKSVTLWAPRLDTYAIEPAPPTVGKLADALEARGISLPLVDLFRWGAPSHDKSPLTQAIDIGPAVIDGVTCEHFAFRQPGVDWQVWIQQGDFALPRKLVITTLSDTARPQYTATIDWNMAPSMNEQTFTFSPPPSAKRVAMINAAKKPERSDP